MDLEKQLENCTILIKNLNEENEQLKKRAVNAELELALYKKEYDNSLDNAKDILETCEKSRLIYEDAINELKESKEKYDATVKELYKLKATYKKELEKFIDKIGM